jgi:hypothetical protein
MVVALQQSAGVRNSSQTIYIPPDISFLAITPQSRCQDRNHPHQSTQTEAGFADSQLRRVPMNVQLSGLQHSTACI